MSSATLPRPSQHILKRTREWFRKAEHELAFLDYAPFDLDDPPTDTAGKMAHMASEYSLKAYLMFNKRKITKTHDLVELLDQCIAIHDDADFEDIRDDCQALTRYKVEFTYPGPLPEQISVEEARSAIQKAHNIYDFIRAKAETAGYLVV